MASGLSARLREIVEAIPLRPGMRVLEIGCGPGAAARAIAARIGDGHVLGIDRSAVAIRQALTASWAEVESGRLSFRQAAVEDFTLESGEQPYDLALAVRVGVLDGRHPQAELRAHHHLAAALAPGAKLYLDGGTPLREIRLRTE
ncbi:SAM-dependent methyltransferase [Nocardia mexicana]|uniref:Methyltransferase family protein n=1 Tax=Nocardia mexicana TaxID=279262 RepID=A0A370GKX7_9NOCA|nr:methyltransferase domain-containing protein [Nocardia mexicana]RDI44428.1 methyltransferase family protein [Nocardia mexicana]